MVASLRHESANGAAKREKDILQASLLVEAMATARRQDDLALVFADAWNRGANWRGAIQRGLHLLDPGRQDAVETIVRRALSDIGEKLDGFTEATRRTDWKGFGMRWSCSTTPSSSNARQNRRL
nr:hypothetical protein [Mesorhizobium sp.]